MEILNAKITSTKLTMGDHGCLTFWIGLEGAGWGVSYGGYCIGHGYLGADEFIAETGNGLEAMMRIMDIVGVDTWEDLVGKYVRVKNNGWGKPVDIIGNVMKDKWFNIKEFFAASKVDDENRNQETTLKSYLEEQLKDPEFAKAYKETKEEIEKELKETMND